MNDQQPILQQIDTIIRLIKQAGGWAKKTDVIKDGKLKFVELNVTFKIEDKEEAKQ